MAKAESIYVAEAEVFGQDWFSSGRTKEECLSSLKKALDKYGRQVGGGSLKSIASERGYESIDEYLYDYLGVVALKVRIGAAYVNWLGSGD